MSDEMDNWLSKCLADCDLGDRRLTERAMKMGQCFSVKYGQPLSTIFDGASDLKRAYEFFANPKTTFFKLTQPQHQQTAREIATLPIVLSVGDPTYLDYHQILAKQDEYGPLGAGGNGLILHSSLAVDPDNGQPLGLLWEKLWKREPLAIPPQKRNASAKEETSGSGPKREKKTPL